MYSDPFYGRIAFRNVSDVARKQQMPQMYCGRTIPREVIADAVGGRGLPKDFDGKAYLKANPDVARARVNPAKHYLEHGKIEGRKLKP